MEDVAHLDPRQECGTPPAWASLGSRTAGHLYMSRIAGKLSGFRSKKNSGGLPGTNSWQRLRISLTSWTASRHPDSPVTYLTGYQLAQPRVRLGRQAGPDVRYSGQPDTRLPGHPEPLSSHVQDDQAPPLLHLGHPPVCVLLHRTLVHSTQAQTLAWTGQCHGGG